MTGRADMAEDPLAVERKRLRFRSWHRGTREADLLLGRFADTHLADMDGTALAAFAALLTLPDPDLLDWVTGRATLPAGYDGEVARQLRDFRLRLR
jgi:antitoxin CptB